MRGFGYPEGNWVLEQVFERAAKKLQVPTPPESEGLTWSDPANPIPRRASPSGKTRATRRESWKRSSPA